MQRTLLDNLRLHTVPAVVLCISLAIGVAESFHWGRIALDDMIPIWAMLFLLFYDHFSQPWNDTSRQIMRIETAYQAEMKIELRTKKCLLISNICGAWMFLFLSAVFMASGIALARCSVLNDNGQLNLSIGSNVPMILRNLSLALLVISVMIYRAGWHFAACHWMLPVISMVFIPFYELILLEFSFPLRLLSTNIAVFILRLLSFSVTSNGTTMFWQGNEIAITDACSGMSLMGILLFVAYWIVRKTSAPAWQKSCWFSFLLIWILFSNTIRLILTFWGFMLIGDRVFASVPHFLLGCLFVIMCSLLLWLSNDWLFTNVTRQSNKKNS